ncbi:MAG: VWA domain-containing protein [Planctomycetes bacterium]|nr:VWA domain-containing protein [Planctomycetota bacterium]
MPKLHPRLKPTDRANRAGAAMVLMVFFLVIVIGMVAFAVDAGLTVLLGAEIQNAVDSGALAAGLRLQDNANDIEAAEDAARRFVRLNRVGMTALIAEDAIDVEAGIFDSDANTFTATNNSPNAVRVFARQDSQPFFFAKIFGQTTFGAPAEAIASADPRPLDAMMVLDLSGSMESSGRIEALWNAAPVFVDIIEELESEDSGPEDHIGMMGLSAHPAQYDPEDEGHSGIEYNSGLHPTSNHNVGVLEAVLDDNFSYLRNTVLSQGNLPAGKYTNYTGTGAALGDAAHYLAYGAEAREGAKRAIVLMSDGAANRPSGNGPGYARTMAAYAAGLNVTVYTISLGNGADVDLMQDIADIGGGIHFDATGSGESALTDKLTEAFRRAAAAMKRVKLVQ